MASASIIVTIGSTAYNLPILPFDPQPFNLRQTTRKVFADAFPTSSRASMDTLLGFKSEVQKPPLYVGRFTNYDRSHIATGENINAMFPGKVHIGPLRQLATWTSPATATSFQFFEGISKLYLFGVGAADTDEPVYVFTGSTTTFGDGTLNADDADVVKNIVGMAQRGTLVYALYNTRDAGTHSLASTTNGTTWTPIADLILTSANDRIFGGFAAQGPSISPWQYIYALVWNTAAGTETNGVIRPYVHDGTAWAAMTGDAILGDNTAPRGFEPFLGPDGFMDFMISTKDRLYWADRSATAQSVVIKDRLRYTFPYGTYTGKLAVDPDGKSLWVTDGPNVRRIFWTDTSGKIEAPSYGPGSRHDLDPLYEGLPADQQGDVTAITPSIINPRWLYVAVGGLTNTTKRASIRVLDTAIGKWHPPFFIEDAASPSRVITALYESQFDDGIVRLMAVSSDNGSGGNARVHFFVDAPSNPEYISTYKFALSGFVESTSYDGGLISLQKGFYRIVVTSDNLTGTTDTDERIDIQSAADNASLGTAQTVGGTGQVFGVWTDGATTAVGTDGVRHFMRLTLKRRSTSNTASPRMTSFSTEFEVLGLKADLTPIRQYEFRVSLDPADFTPGVEAESPKNARDILDLMEKNRPLLKLAVGQDAPVGSEVKVRLETPRTQWRTVADVRDQNALPVDGPGYEDIKLVEVR